MSANAAIIAATLLTAVAVGQQFETGDNSTVKGCSTHCTYGKADYDCWSKNVRFFELLLLAQMRHYVAVQINIDQWHRRHSPLPPDEYRPDFEGMRRETLKRLSAELNPDDFLTNKTLHSVVGTLMDRVADGSQEILPWAPHYSCPLPCEHRYNVWRNLFIASVILNVCMIAATLPNICRAARRDNSDSLL